MSVNDVLTGIQNDTTRVNAEKSQSRVGQSTLDQDSFLQLLMTQLKYQDPLNPIDNSQFMSQQAQLTQVSELQKLNQNNSFLQASTFIGRNVAFSDPYSINQTVVGTVTEAQVSSKGINLTVTGIKKDSNGDSIKDSAGNEVIETNQYAITDVMKNSGNISIANPYTGSTDTSTDTSTTN
ncbi:MAG: flagellar hook capping FlgD N-terminal domain-containing protein [Candidatus Gastranaerophilales bacterium]|nr:flagellar hook capping FlgD N-terminal domain-containing protein [Candidatus Gastranaerophilales bacterium]